MNPPRVTSADSIDFPIATPTEASACEAAHDAFSRLLTRLERDPETLWNEVRPHVTRRDSILIIDDTVLGKPYAHKIGLVGPF